MIYRRKYLQFNDLVIDNYDMLLSSSHAVDFKGTTSEYSFGHGSYAPYKGVFAKAQNIPLSITLHMKKLPCNYRPFYKQFAIKEITTPGKLWAIENNELIWAYAKITSISEDLDVRKDEYRIEADFLVWEGVWHKADRHKTFLLPYNPCDFMECLKYKEPESCKNMVYDCVTACVVNKVDHTRDKEDDCSCCCDSLTPDMALCYHDDLQIFYKDCTPSYQIAYDCRKGNEFFGDKYLGEKICTKDTCSNVIAGTIYSDTEIPTQGYEIVIDGPTKDPQITINGNRNVIKGEHDILFIESNGDVFEEDRHHRARVALDPDQWVVPDMDSSYGWEFTQGTNRVIVDRGSCCGRACVYINVDSLTI